MTNFKGEHSDFNESTPESLLSFAFFSAAEETLVETSKTQLLLSTAIITHIPEDLLTLSVCA